MDPLVHAYLRESQLLEYVEFNADATPPRLRCRVTGHELPPADLAAVQRHFQGKRFALHKQNLGVDWASYEAAHIVPDRANPKRLFCQLTRRHLNRLRGEVDAHIVGRSYQAALRLWEAGVGADMDRNDSGSSSDDEGFHDDEPGGSAGDGEQGSDAEGAVAMDVEGDAEVEAPAGPPIRYVDELEDGVLVYRTTGGEVTGTKKRRKRGPKSHRE